MGSSVILPAPGQPHTGADPDFKSAAIPNIVTFGFDQIDPPSAVYVQQDDKLQVIATTQLANDTVTLVARLLLPFAQRAGQPGATSGGQIPGGPIVGPGYIQTVQRVLALSSALGLFNFSFPLPEGYLLSVTLQAGTAALCGSTFARCYLVRGAPATPPVNVAQMLISNYLTSTGPITWPGGQNIKPADGPGQITVATPANPAAGADFTFTSTLPGRIRLQSVKAKLVTSGVAGNRVPSFQLVQQGTVNVVYSVQDTAAVVASSTVVYSLAPGGTNVRGAGAIATEQDVTLPVPAPYFGTSGITVQSTTQGILGGDQWSALVFTMEQWLDLD